MMKQRILLGLTALIACSFYAGTSTASDNETAITTWVVIFNNPEECRSIEDDGCGEEDFEEDDEGGDVEADFCFLAGQSVQANKRFTLAGWVAEGHPESCELGIGIIDADKAEIHMILQEHGPALPSGEGREEQVAFFWGNCNPVPATDDDPGSCVDTQFAVHNPDAAVDGVSVRPVQRNDEDESEVAGSRSTLYREANGIRMVNHTRLDD